jgi:uncharacterized protein (DUF169 family)
MALNQDDLLILEKFKFDLQPVCIKYVSKIPEKITKLNEKIAFCEMLKKAQSGEVFYSDVFNHTCEAGPYVLGYEDGKEQFLSGQFGAGLEAFKDERAASRVYHYIPKIAKGVIRYVAFAPLDKLQFDPDVIVFLVNLNHAWILLRAISYKTGKMWSSKCSAVISCSWLMVYPYLTGEINFFSSGLGFGIKRRKLFPEELQFISIPFDQFHNILEALREMPWLPMPFKSDGMEYVKNLRKKLDLE